MNFIICRDKIYCVCIYLIRGLYNEAVTGLLFPVQGQPGRYDPRFGVDPKHVRLARLRLDRIEDLAVLARVLVAGTDGDDSRADRHGLTDLCGVGGLLKDGLVVVNVLHIDLKKVHKFNPMMHKQLAVGQ